MSSSNIEYLCTVVQMLGDVIDDDCMCEDISHVLTTTNRVGSILIGIGCFGEQFSIDCFECLYFMC